MPQLESTWIALSQSNPRRITIEKLDPRPFEGIEYSINISSVPSDEAEIPETYWLPQPAKLGWQAVLRDLRGDVAIPGAVLNNGGKTISVRTQ